MIGICEFSDVIKAVDVVHRLADAEVLIWPLPYAYKLTSALEFNDKEVENVESFLEEIMHLPHFSGALTAVLGSLPRPLTSSSVKRIFLAPPL